MIVTIFCSILVAFIIWCTIEKQEEFILICGTVIIGIILSVSLLSGYKKTDNKEEILYKLQYEYSNETVKEAEKYNSDVHFGNNYWCRFSLKNEDLTDIDYYKSKNKVLNVLYNTKVDSIRYLKLQNRLNISANKENENELIITFSDLHIFSISEISLHIMKENNLIYLVKDSVDDDINELEDKVYSFIKEQIEA